MRRIAAAGLAALSSLAFAGPQPIGQRELSGRDNRFVEIPAGRADAGFRAVAPGRRMAFDDAGVRMRLAGPRLDKAGGAAALRYAFEGGAKVAPQGIKPSPTLYHWLVGERADWMPNLKSYGAIAYRGVWPGVDAVFAGDAGGFKYQFELAAGVQPGIVALVVEGADGVRVTEAGALEWTIGGETVLDDAPLAFQPEGAGHATLAAAYRVEALDARRWRIGFEVAGHDPAKALIIDPAWTGYSGLVGGNSQDQVYGVARSGSNTFACGVTRSGNLPGGTAPKGQDDAFVVKFDQAGAAQFVTYVGGSGDDICNGIALDASEAIYLAGGTTSTDFSTAGAGSASFPRANAGARDAFVMRLAADGSTIIWSGYLGGSLDDQANAIAVDSTGRAYITGFSVFSATTPMPTTVGPRLTHGSAAAGSPNMDPFVARVNAAGSAMEYAGFIGGDGGTEMGNAIAVGTDFSAYVAGATDSSTGLPALGGLRTAINARPVGPTGGDASDGFVAKVASGGASLEFLTLLTGSAPTSDTGADRAYAIALAGDGSLIVAGETDSPSFPANNAGTRQGGGPQFSKSTGMDGFVVRLNSTGTSVLSATYLGGSGYDAAEAIATDGTSFFVTGSTSSADFPGQAANGLAATRPGMQDAFLAKFALGAAGSFAYSGYVGTMQSDILRALSATVVGGHTILSAGGATTTTILSHLANPTQGASGSLSPSSGLVLRIDPFGPPNTVTVQSGTPQSVTIFQPFPTALSVLVRDLDNQVLANVPVTFSAPTLTAGATFSTSTVTTNASGVATTNATANGFAGAYNVTATATVPTGSASATIALTNLKGDQLISFGTLADRTMLSSSFMVAATGGASGLPVTFSTLTTTSCTVTTGGIVTLVGAGTCTIDADQAGNANYNAAPQVSRSFTVSRVAQAITFDPLADRTILDTPFALSATGGGSGLAVTFSTTTTTTCTVSGTSVTLVGEGTCTIDANQEGNATYSPAPQVSRSFAVTRAAQAIDFGTLADRSVDSGSFTVSATGGGSGLPVTFSSLTAPVCTVSGTLVSLVTTGQCTIAADQAGNTVYAPAPQATRSFQVTPDVTPPDTTLDAATTGLVNTASASFSFSTDDPTATFECSLDGAAFSACASPQSYTGLAEGPHTFAVRARDPAGNADPTPATASWTVDTVGPVLAITSKPAITAANEAAYAIAGTCSDDGRAVTAQIGSIMASATCGTPAAGQFATAPVDASGLAQGLVSLQASSTDAAGNTATVTDSTTKDTLGPALTIDTLDPVNNGNKASYGFAGSCETAGGAVDYTLTATASVNGSVACASGAYAVSGLDLTALADGTVAVSVTQPDALGNVTTTNGSVAKDTAAPSVAIDAAGFVNAANQASYAVTGTCSENGRDVVLGLSDGTATAPATVACGATTAGLFSATFNLAGLQDGPVSIAASHADAAGNVANANAATTKDTVVAPPAITSPAAGAAVATNPAISGIGESGATVSVVNGATPVCTATVAAGAWSCASTLGAGAYTLTATQVDAAGNASTASAAVSFTVQGGQTISFAPLASRVFGTAPFQVSATATSGLTVQFSSNTPSVCTVSGTTVTLVAAGNCEIAADQPGDATNAPAPQVRQSFEVTKAAQSIAFGPLAGRTFGEAPFAVSATGGASGNPVVFSSLTPACSVAGNMVTLLGGGTCDIAADQAGDANYDAAPRVTQSFLVARAAQAISFAALPPRAAGDPPFAVTATASSGLAVEFSTTTTAVCTVAGGNVTPVAAGTCTIDADQAGDASFLPAPRESQSFAVLPGPSVLTVSATGGGAGTVTSSPGGIDCGAACSAPFANGTVVTLTATGAAGSAFAGWSGACTGTGTCVVTMDAAKSVAARFDLRPVRADTNADRRADLFWREAAPFPGVSWWTMDGAAATSGNFINVAPDWSIARVGDLDGDGRADIVWRFAPTNAYFLWRLDGLAPVGFADLGVPTGSWVLAGTGDLDGDGKADLVWRGADGAVYAWFMDGGTIRSHGPLGSPGAAWAIAGVSDLNGDGRDDLVFRNSIDGQVFVWMMNGYAVTASGATGALDPFAWTLRAAADFDGDGKGDYLWLSASGEAWIWMMDGTAFRSGASIGTPGAGFEVRAVGDFDGDGRADIVWRHADGTAVYWRMDGTTVTAAAPVANPGGTWQIVAP